MWRYILSNFSYLSYVFICICLYLFLPIPISSLSIYLYLPFHTCLPIYLYLLIYIYHNARNSQHIVLPLTNTMVFCLDSFIYVCGSEMSVCLTTPNLLLLLTKDNNQKDIIVHSSSVITMFLGLFR